MPLLSPKVYDCVIIGTGISALTLAKSLISNTSTPLSVLLLEARTRVGGRAFTEGGLDAGCGSVHGFDHNPITNLLEEYGLKTHVFKNPSQIILDDDVKLSSKAGAFLLKTSKDHTTEAIAAISREESASASISLATTIFSGIHPSALEVGDRMKVLARMTEIGAGITLEEISAKYFGIAKNISGVDASVVGGYSCLINKMVEDLKSKGVEITLGQEVIRVQEQGDFVEIESKGGEVYMAKCCVSTIPLGVLQKRAPKFVPELTEEFKAVVQRTKVGILEKIFLQYDEAWWPATSSTSSYLLLPILPLGAPPTNFLDLLKYIPVSITNLNYTLSTLPSKPTLQIYIGASSGKFLDGLSNESVELMLHGYLISRFLPSIISATAKPGAKAVPFTIPNLPINSVITNWQSDPFSLGATSSPIAISSSPEAIQSTPGDFKLLHETMWGGKLGWAGEHTDFDHRGSVVGAYVSGVREAERVKLYLSGRD